MVACMERCLSIEPSKGRVLRLEQFLVFQAVIYRHLRTRSYRLDLCQLDGEALEASILALRSYILSRPVSPVVGI